MESKRSKYVLIGLCVFCIILIVVTSFVDGFLNPLRTSIGFFLNPIQSGVNKAGTSLYNGISNFSRLKVKLGDADAKNRLMEGTLGYIVELVKAYENQGLPLGDLVQEANMAVIMALGEPESLNFGDSGDVEGLTAFRSYIKKQVEEALQTALAEQKNSEQVGEELLARVNVLKDISQQMAEELGREATVEELARKMKMTEDEIKDIMKLTLDAMSVSPDAEI